MNNTQKTFSEVNGAIFTWSKECGDMYLGLADISDFGPGFKFKEMGDAFGMSVKNDITGQLREFGCTNVFRDKEHEVLGWEMTCLTDKKLKLSIFND